MQLLQEESKEFSTVTLTTNLHLVLEVYDRLAFKYEAEKVDIEAILLKLEEFYVCATNKTYERYITSTPATKKQASPLNLL